MSEPAGFPLPPAAGTLPPLTEQEPDPWDLVMSRSRLFGLPVIGTYGLLPADSPLRINDGPPRKLSRHGFA